MAREMSHLITASPVSAIGIPCSFKPLQHSPAHFDAVRWNIFDFLVVGLQWAEEAVSSRSLSQTVHLCHSYPTYPGFELVLFPLQVVDAISAGTGQGHAHSSALCCSCVNSARN